MMITFSTSAMWFLVWDSVTSLCIVPDPAMALRASYPRSRPGGRQLLAAAMPPPAGDRPAQLEVGDRARHRRKPERESPVGQDGDHGKSLVDPEGDEGTDHAAIDPADAPRQRQQVAEHAH